MKSFLSLILIFFMACGNQAQKESVTKPEIANAEPIEVTTEDGMARAYFASGCFWCVEAIYESIEGVDESISGYAGGHTKNPTYEESNTGRTGHAEAVEVIYNPEEVDFRTLVEVYFGSQDPTQVNGQGPDRGSQYRSIVFYQNQEQKEIIEEVKSQVAQNYEEPIAAEVLPFQKFWVAEDYHQDYEQNNPNNPYIQNVSIPRLNRFKNKFPEILKADAH
ncbi:peptide-methionine (S)-S-oxide reductase MsrA [Salegentibacter sp. F188]|uniref:Peptide methionine sulfoxide reductase MsrA n=1 Tax=Autumnicola patrickiae TaxID=3075591 RepID=A0ABU3DYT3_9FLAO|nr:peptide-methionine (S)-S-oxide reductase MsrA [Salegentibacter sp. F188]MDT0688894.1 peptide-methionine (S)-S-oxide reductase MsrA [Salegentibacter sp. F188]